MLRARLATAAVAIPLLLALIYWAPGWGWRTTVALIIGLGLFEYLGLAFAERPALRALGLVLALPMVAAAVVQPAPGAALGAALAWLIGAGLSYIVIVRRDLDRALADLGLIAVGALYVALLAPFAWLHPLPDGSHWVTFVIVIGMAGDTGGYFVGHAVGRHKLIPHLSPGKTIEGALGIVLFSLLGGAACKLILLPQRSWTEMLTLSLGMALIGQIGDLGESVMKRSFGVKESGTIFPGHGGVLDRIDSLLFPVCLVYYYLLLSAAPTLEA